MFMKLIILLDIPYSSIRSLILEFYCFNYEILPHLVQDQKTMFYFSSFSTTET